MNEDSKEILRTLKRQGPVLDAVMLGAIVIAGALILTASVYALAY